MSVDPTQPSDAALVLATRAGDLSAFEVLYRRHSPAVRRTVAAVLRRPDGVDDAVQDVFLKALERLPTLREADRVEPWLKQIARNVATDQLRVRTVSDVDAVPERHLEERSVSPADLAEIRELCRLVTGVLAELGPRDLRAVSMAAFLESTPAEIAADLDLTDGAARVVLHRARRRLRNALKLELLVRRGAMMPCPDLARLLEDTDSLKASRHVAECETCQREGSIEIKSYSHQEGHTPLTVTVVVDPGPSERRIQVPVRLSVGRDGDGPDRAGFLGLDDPAVSRRHLDLRLDGTSGTVVAIDTSTNGTHLNGARLDRDVPRDLSTGDHLEVGNTMLIVEIEYGDPALPDAPGPGSVLVTGTTDGSVSELVALATLHGGRAAVDPTGGFRGTWDGDTEPIARRRALDFVDIAARLPGLCDRGWIVDGGFVEHLP